MKFSLTADENKWASSYLSGLSYLINTSMPVTEGERKCVAKMRYKFAPNSLCVWLTKKERLVLFGLINSRLEVLEGRLNAGPEKEFLLAFATKLKGEQHGAN